MRLAAQVRGGFYAAAPEAVEHVASLLARPPGRARYSILDPCCGKGVAVKTLAESVGSRDSDIYAIELERDRYEEAKDLIKAGHVVGPCSYFEVTYTKARFSVVWLNPPFDTEYGGGRVEKQFLDRATDAVAPGGVMIFVVPETVSQINDVRYHFMTYYDDITLIEFPSDHRPYNEVAIIGVRKPYTKPQYSWQKWEVVCQPREPGFYSPTISPGPTLFRRTVVTDAELLEMLSSSPLNSHFKPPQFPPLPSPPMSLGTGHLALLLASGQLDGVVDTGSRDTHVVRGTVKKHRYLAESTTEQTEDGEKTTDIYRERITLTIRAAWQDGNITTLSDKDESENEQ